MTNNTDTSPEYVDRLAHKLMSQVGDDVQEIYDHEALFKLSANTLRALSARLAEVEAERDDLRRQLSDTKKDVTDMETRALDAEAKLAQAREAIDKMNCTTVLAHALEEEAIADRWAWVFEDALEEQNEALSLIDADQPASEVSAGEAARERVARAIWGTLQSDYTFDEARSGEESAAHAQAIKWVFAVADAALRALAEGCE